ncbi:1,4-alpha-glucan branching protein GlgB [Shumkonia mesophila]|uniref:1,4-alpha-glucan branching protein GlgB n=1 Tax=Shumkonia mesophila TaxID=2838854 RepID=UPI002934F1D8|nr:1,4-alpha-glucan branching protein GlgB [Shumkonia mesophila]
MPQSLDRNALNALASGDHADPFGVLGMHEASGGRLLARACLPGARSVAVVDAADGTTVADLPRIHDAGIFAGPLGKRRQRFAYRLRVDWNGEVVEAEDAYRFPPVISDFDLHLLGEGNHLRAYEVMGAHPRTLEGVAGVAFAVWAPNARRVSVVGGFNGWDGRRHVMRLRHSFGIWEIFVPGIGPGEPYKFEIKAGDGRLLPLKTDPYAFAAEVPPKTASVVVAAQPFAWTDELWRGRLGETNALDAPVSVYEVHLGSWRRKPEEGNRYLTYRELAGELVPYVRDLGFTHIELMPVSEFPFDGSWGYQPIGLFAPTSRFGSPDDFRAFVDACHAADIGVLIDWVPGHFPTDEHGLGLFDGTHLYEHADPRKGRHTDWGTLIYNYGRREVANFLLANARYWIDSFHIDGLRVDAVASMLYLDYSRKAGEWVPNQYGGNENLEAVAFLKRMNEVIFGENGGATTVAEESTAWPMVSRPTYLGGLGFGLKWNMGWMHDTLQYMSKEPIYRRYHPNNLTFGLLYAFTENFVLALSHDEVVHGKGSLLGKMPGDRWQKFANLRAYFAFMFGHPGKKLLFMGADIAQEREWSHDRSLDWHLLDDPLHAGAKQLVGDLNRLYRAAPALYEVDFEPAGFSWIDCQDVDNSVVSFLRRGKRPEEVAVVVCNFTPVVHHGYRIGVPSGDFYVECINTDAADYGGSGVGNLGGVQAEAVPAHGHPWSVNLTLPPLAVLILRPRGIEGQA